MIKKILIGFIILSSLSFFQLIIIPEMAIKALEFVTPALILFLVIVINIYDRTPRFKSKFNVEVFLVFISVIFSMFGAYYFHNQGFAITFVTQRFIYFFFLYYLLRALKPNPNDLFLMMVYVGIIYAVFYLLQTFFYPAKLTRAAFYIQRGTVRIFIPGTGFLVFAYFLGLSQFLKTFQIRYFILCLLAILIFILLGTRIVLASVALLTILYVLLSKRVSSKVMAAFLILLAIVPAYFLFIDIFVAMFNVSEKQFANIGQDVRVRAAIFFLFEFFPNKLSYIIGNGVSSTHSAYGIRINEYKEAFGFFQSDIGIIGDYTKFGLLFLVAELTVIIRVIFMRLPDKLDFIRYTFMAIALTMFTGLGVFCIADAIVLVCLLLYCIDVYKDKRYEELMNPSAIESPST